MVSFPTSLDALSNPTSTTKRNAAGFELDVVIGTLNDIVEALEAKLGITASTAAANTVLGGNSAGASTYRQVATGDIAAGAVTARALSAAFNGTRTAAGYVDVDSTNGKVTLTTVGGDLLVIFNGYASNTSASINQSIALKLDSGSDLGALSVYSLTGAATYPIPFSSAYIYTSVSAASHTIYARHSNNTASGTMTTNGQLFVVELKK